MRLLLHHPAKGFQRDVAPRRISDLRRDPQTLIWLDVEAPTPEEWALLRREFGFHPLALEDAEHAHQRPKIEQYNDFYLLVVYAVSLDGEEGSLVTTREVTLFIGSNYLVTVHSDPVPVIQEVAARWQAKDTPIRPGISPLLYTLLDAAVDDYFPVVDELGDRIDDLEDRILAEADDGGLQAVFRMKRALLALRRILGPERDAVNVLMRRELPFVDAESILYFQDVYDHLVRLTDSVDTFRDILASTLDAHLSVVSNRLNQVMRTLTAISAVLMSMALIAGIYGMNFRFIPELSWRYGYYLSLGMMALIGLVLAYFFRRKGWW
ncbi:MAG: magnesium/cobalt transporter CorA [Armatimonadetes bacterium]|nr:magnesium/cobalt transporter CorA [Armatimonadota bacterium]